MINIDDNWTEEIERTANPGEYASKFVSPDGETVVWIFGDGANYIVRPIDDYEGFSHVVECFGSMGQLGRSTAHKSLKSALRDATKAVRSN